jgi:hypothetical protein
MRVVFSGGPCHAMAAGRFPCFARTVTRHAVTSMAGNGIAFRDGRTASGVSVGGAALVRGCATLPRVAICVQVVSGGLGSSASCFVLSETCHGRSPGFRTCSPRLKRRQKLASVSCHPSVGMGSGERPYQEGLVSLKTRFGYLGHCHEQTYLNLTLSKSSAQTEAGYQLDTTCLGD